MMDEHSPVITNMNNISTHPNFQEIQSFKNENVKYSIHDHGTPTTGTS